MSRLWIKTATDHQTLTLIAALTMFWMMGVMMGPIYAAIDDVHHSLQPLLDLWEEQGAVELNYPPDYPKMPGEPPRVQPSRKNAANWEQPD